MAGRIVVTLESGPLMETYRRRERLDVSTPKKLGKEMSLFRVIASAWGRMFAPKGDNFKALLMADLGMKR